MIKLHLAIISLFFCIDRINAQSLCGDWVAYKDVKCYNIFESSGLQTYEDAINVCHQQSNNANLVTINNLDEQSFLTTLIFNTSKIVDNVWIGAKHVNSHYEWFNGLSLTYTNWAEGYPKNLTESCVEMHSDPYFVGKWIDASCKRKNLVVCQKFPNWSQTHIQEAMLNFQETQKSFQETLASLKQNIIPIGFIYVQFPTEKTPQEIWSWMTWKDITSSYAGLFFRAFGGNSSSFGTTQEANAPRINKVESRYWQSSGTVDTTWLSVDISDSDWSKWLFTGRDAGGLNFDIRFHSSADEVRPRNIAIRIWKREA